MQLHSYLQALRELGWQPLALNLLYRFGLATGHYARLTSTPPLAEPGALKAQTLWPLPSPATLRACLGSTQTDLLAEADELCQGQIRLFGSAPRTLELTPTPPLAHWTEYETHRAAWGVEDVKFLWEPARLGWLFTLGRAYLLTAQEEYAQHALRLLETFWDANPPYLGPNWASGQEVALRVMALAFAASAFAASPAFTPSLQQRLGQSVLAHAARIPPTLVYARSQQNNHLISEAVGLYTAGLLLPRAPQAVSWRELGWRWLNRALIEQIDPNGSYIQQSANYHRLMLHAALWAAALARQEGRSFAPLALERLQAATHWLIARLDRQSGRTPNLGSNDGANILPLAGGGFDDFRPTAQAAALTFLGQPCLPNGTWDELSLWLGLENELRSAPVWPRTDAKSGLLHYGAAWAGLRAAHFSARPGHADQLHVDLWFRGQPVALDAGTYQYNAAPPWDNRLSGSQVHNTLTLDGRDQMRRAGRFLWLERAQAQILTQDECSASAQHNGYTRLGLIHRRTLRCLSETEWQVLDDLLPCSNQRQTHSACLHWLLPDWPWQLNQQTLQLQAPWGLISLALALSDPGCHAEIQLMRAGQVLVGSSNASPNLGWQSPTYGEKRAALSFKLSWQGSPPCSAISTWQLAH